MEISKSTFEPVEGFAISVLEALSHSGVDYLVFGGYAVRAYLPNRRAKDIDLLVHPSQTNLGRLQRALATISSLPEERIVECVQRGRCKFSHSGVEIVGEMLNLPTDGLFARKECRAFELEDGEPITICVLSLDDLIESKRLAIADPARAESAERDRADYEALSCLRPAV